MNALNKAGQITLTEKSIREVAQNLKHLLDIAENTYFLGFEFKAPSASSVLNAVCTMLGYSSVKGMSERLKAEQPQVSLYANAALLHLSPVLDKFNPGMKLGRLQEITNLANFLVLELFTSTDLPKGLAGSLARIRSNRVNTNIAPVLHAHNGAAYSEYNSLVKTLMSTALDSVSLEYMWMDNFSSTTQIPLFRYFKPNSYKPEMREQLIECCKWVVSGTRTSNRAIACSLHGELMHVCFSSGASGLRHYTLSNLFRSKLLAQLCFGPDRHSYVILRNLMQYPDLNMRLIEIAKHDLEFRHCTDPLHPEFAIGVLCEMQLAQEKAIDLIYCALSGDLSQTREFSRLNAVMYQFDLYALCSHSALMDIYDYSLSSKKEQESLLSYSLISPNALYWLAQLGTIEFLKCAGTVHAQAGIRYIELVMEKYPAVAMTESMAKVLQSAEFLLIKDDLLSLVRKYLSTQLNKALLGVKAALSDE